MARRGAARGTAGGGDGIQAPRRGRTGLIAGGGAVACAAAVAVYPAVSAGRVSWLPPAVGAVGVGLVVASIVLGRPVLVAWSVALLGAEYAVWLSLDEGGTNTRAPLVAAGLLLVAELGYEAQTPPAGEVELEVLLRRLVLLAALALGAIALGAVVLGIASVPLTGGLALTAIGAVAAVLALVVVWRIAAGRQ